MNKKIAILLIICFASFLVMGSVSAANLKNHNFDDYFSMDIPKDMSFQKMENSTEEAGVEFMQISYVSDNTVILYMDTPVFSENSSDFMFQSLFESLNPDLTKCYESQDDNLKIIEPVGNDGQHLTVVGTSSGNKVIILAGLDKDLLKDMAHTIEFE